MFETRSELRLLTVPEVARLLRESKPTVYRKIKLGVTRRCASATSTGRCASPRTSSRLTRDGCGRFVVQVTVPRRPDEHAGTRCRVLGNTRCLDCGRRTKGSRCAPCRA